MYHRCRIPSLSTRLSSTFSSYRRFPSHLSLALQRPIHSSSIFRNSSKPQPFLNILADEVPPPVQVSSISPSGIQLTDGLIIPGKVFLWDPPRAFWDGWKEEHFELFQVVVPKPEILLLGTGKTIFQPPPFIRDHLNKMGIQLDVMDTRNACSTYNLLAEEGRRVAAALLPLYPRTWQKAQTGTDSK
ncbi:NADH dehydrogenase 1 alpha subcomplex assembly factor 3 [Rhodocollybia butyracea]|uniref:NADH dehydrogenase [ubiquinone] 1 alpha subcomplex assembly factor 3 n=1 Tax=Rhodocollybia butyracea TaxID=206335 RepID=A0A9P5PTF8_9AGAR|nr:NADH dehydrogenase 1 alpha subcomplex assembly factor 3 [Rhodocollybia butyracea]